MKKYIFRGHRADQLDTRALNDGARHCWGKNQCFGCKPSMISLLWLAIVVCLMSITSLSLQAQSAAHSSGELVWHTNYDEAMAEVREKDKTLLINFSGSDWCGYCIWLDDNIFNKQEFTQFAKENLVLLFIDFPKSYEIPEEEEAVNRALMNKFGVKGFPTIFFCDKEESQLFKTGYRPISAQAYVNELKAGMGGGVLSGKIKFIILGLFILFVLKKLFFKQE